MAVFDTTFLIDWSGSNARLRERAEAVIIAAANAGERLFTTRFNIAEMWIGVHRAADPLHERTRIQKIIRGFQVLDFDAVAAELFGQCTADLQRRGRPVGDVDVLIAAVAIANEQRVITRNTDHFREIRGLHVESN